MFMKSLSNCKGLSAVIAVIILLHSLKPSVGDSRSAAQASTVRFKLLSSARSHNDCSNLTKVVWPAPLSVTS